MRQASARRALWRGVGQMPWAGEAGLSLPVKLYTAVRPEQVAFHLLHAEDGARLQQRMVCPLDNQPVDADHILKGYEVADGEYVLMNPAELKRLNQPPPEASRRIALEEFVDAETLDGRYYERHYYLLPESDSRPYAALHRALEATRSLGICRWSMRGQAYLGAIRPMAAPAGALILAVLRYHQEIVPWESLALPQVAVSSPEMQTAKYLVQLLASDFAPADWRNEYQARLREMIERKIRGEPVEARPLAPTPPTPDAHLLEALRASVAAAEHRARP